MKTSITRTLTLIIILVLVTYSSVAAQSTALGSQPNQIHIGDEELIAVQDAIGSQDTSVGAVLYQLGLKLCRFSAVQHNTTAALLIISSNGNLSSLR